MAEKAHISVYDLDRTLLNDNSSFRFGLYLCNKGYFKKRVLLFILWCRVCYLFRLMSITELHTRAFNYLFKGHSADLINHWVEQFLNSQFDKLLYTPAISQLRKDQHEGRKVMILSSAPDFLISPIAYRLGIKSWKGTEYALDDNRCFSLISHLMLGKNKADCLKELKASNKDVFLTAYSDSEEDLPFLLEAHHAIGVNPDRKLRLICQQKCWPII